MSDEVQNDTKELCEEKDRELIASWDKEARTLETAEDLVKFIEKLESYNHGYGSVVEAIIAAMRGAFSVMNKKQHITGFQAQFIAWAMLYEFLGIEKDRPLKLVNIGDMLYPQGEEVFAKRMSDAHWNWLVEKAEAKLKENPPAHEDVRKHWQSIVDGKVPFGYKVD